MSIGFGGFSRIVLQDESTVIYEYSPYNLNDPAYRNAGHIYDGLITISKDALVEPEIHEKTKRLPGGRRKAVVKRIRQDVEYAALFSAEKIAVENSRFCWIIAENSCGLIAKRLISMIFNCYQDTGTLPVEVSYHV